MKIEIDVREHALIGEIERDESFQITTVKKQLDIGDLKLYDDENNIKLLIERKTISDLVSSIKDGRYTEQSMRLNSYDIHNHNIIYLIEGNVFAHKDANMALSAMYSLYYYKGFSVWQSLNVRTTKELIKKFALKMEKEIKKISYYETIDVKPLDNMDYINCIKSTKKENITSENIHQIMLAQIPNISTNISKIILSRYKTIFELKKAIDEDVNCMNDLTMSCSNGKERKISSLAVKNIIKYLTDCSD